MDEAIDNRKLDLPQDVILDEDALELVTVWYSKGKVKVLTRDGTLLDERLNIWAEVVAGVIKNIADHASGYDVNKSPGIEKELATLVRDQIIRRQ